MRWLQAAGTATMILTVLSGCGAGSGASGTPGALPSTAPASSPVATEREPAPGTEAPLPTASPVASASAAPATAATPGTLATPAAAPTPSPVATPSPSSAPPGSAPSSNAPAARAGCLRNAARDVLVGEILDAIRLRDRAALRGTMASTFQYMVEATDVGLQPVSARLATRQLFQGVPDPDGSTWFVPVGHGGRVRCVASYRPADLGASRGFWPTQWDVAVEVEGLGADGDATGWLMLGTSSSGRPVWRGLLFGFPGVDLFE